MMKVFDCQDMPEEVKKAYFQHYRDAMVYSFNGSYLEWAIADEIFDEPDGEWAVCKKRVDEWLIANGAEGPPNADEEGESVLIQFWW